MEWATLFTRDDFPQRRGEMRMELTPAEKFCFSRLLSASRSVNSRPLAILPNTNGVSLSAFMLHKCKLHYCKLQISKINYFLKLPGKQHTRNYGHLQIEGISLISSLLYASHKAMILKNHY